MDLISKEGRQEYLNMLLKQELQWLKKKCFYRKHRPFLFEKVEVVEYRQEQNKEEMFAGRYTNNSEKAEENYTHKIEIESRVLDNIQNPPWRVLGKKWYKKYLRETIRHELCHAYVFERFEQMAINNLVNVHADASPIFLALLQFLNVKSAHDCNYSYKHSKFFGEVNNIKSFDELEDYLISLYLQYIRIIRRLEDNSKDFNGNRLIAHSFMFGTRESSLKLKKEYSNNYIMFVPKNGKVEKLYSYNCSWWIGSCVHPEMLEKLLDKKIKGIGNFEKTYMIKSGKTFTVKNKYII